MYAESAANKKIEAQDKEIAQLKKELKQKNQTKKNAEIPGWGFKKKIKKKNHFYI